MNFLFVHQNFPGQYLHLAAGLVRDGHRVVSISQRAAGMAGVEHVQYAPEPPAGAEHQHLIDLADAVRCGLAVARACEGLRAAGFAPDVVVGHSGWGEILYVKDVWPGAKLLGYFEFFYGATGSDMDFDPEFPPDPEAAKRLRTRNAIGLAALEAADWGITPTRFQRDRYPLVHRGRISIIHEGVDTDAIRPDPHASLWLSGGRAFEAGAEIVTFSARNLEPYRGFHVFMRALPEILRRRPRAHVLIVGGNEVSYGRLPEDFENWREAMLAELGHRLDARRVHFLGTLPFAQYLTVLQLSAVHVYMTYPFVLSWSLIEAAAAGCRIVASRTAPVEEVITDGVDGHLVDFFDSPELAWRVCECLRDNAGAVREAARATAVRRYSLKQVCLPMQLNLLSKLYQPVLSPTQRKQAVLF